MHIVTVRMDRVFDVKPDYFSTQVRRTLFSFEANGKAHYSVCVEGSPVLHSGQTITAILTRPDDWQTLVGMKIHESGEVCVQAPALYAWLIALCTFFAVIAFMELQFLYPQAVWPMMLCYLAAMLYSTYRMIQIRKVIQALK